MKKKPMSPKMKQALAKLAALPEKERKQAAKMAWTRLALAELGRIPMANSPQLEHEPRD